MDRNRFVSEQPTLSQQFRRLPVHDEIEELSTKASTDEAWAEFTKKTLRLEGWKVIAVQEVVRQGRWRTSLNPIGYVKTASIQQANRGGLREDTYKRPKDRSLRCSCGFTTKAKASKMGHECAVREVGCIADIQIPEAAWFGSDITGQGLRVSHRGAHDNAIDFFIHIAEREEGIDCQEPFEMLDNQSRCFVGSHSLCLIKPEFLKMVLFAGEKGSEESDRDEEEDYDGYIRVDWVRAGRAAGLTEFESLLLYLRYGRNWSRKEIMSARGKDASGDEAVRLRNQAALKAIDRRLEVIHKIIRIDRPAFTEADYHRLGLQVAPAIRRTAIPNPEWLRDDSAVLNELDNRFPSAPKDLGWGQKFPTGRRH
jgi:hypothetical protein